MCRSLLFRVAAALLVGCMGVVHAADSPSASVFDPGQLPTVHGAVVRYTLLPRGAIDGFILKDSTQILAVPLFSHELISAVRIGDEITVYGLKAAALPLVMAMAVINDQSKQAVLLGEIPLMLAMGKAPPHHAPPAIHESAATEEARSPAPARPVQIHGTVEQTIYGPLGTVSGALLKDGVLIRMASTESARMGPLLRTGSTVWAKGPLSEGPLGKLLIAEAIGSSADELTVLAPWDGPL